MMSPLGSGGGRQVPVPLPGSEESIVYVVDDDRQVRESLSLLLASFNLRTMTFGSAAEYLAYCKPDVPACLVLDIRLPDIHGLDFQSAADEAGGPPIVFITGYGDIRSSVRAIRRGAVDFLTKPFSTEKLMHAIFAGIARDRSARARRAEQVALRLRYARLTPREREVFRLVTSGLLNKKAAADLGISENTIQVHRTRIMDKMEAPSLPDLVRMAAALGVQPVCSQQFAK